MPEQFTIPFAHRPDFSHQALIPHAGIEDAQQWLANPADWPTPVLILHGAAASGKSHLAAHVSEHVHQWDLSEAPLDQRHAARLFHTVNDVKACDGRLLILSRDLPPAIYPSLPDLDSRLKAASLVRLIEPKDETVRQAIFFKLCTDRQLRVDLDVAAYVCTRLPQTLIALQAFCDAATQLPRGTLTKAAARPLIAKLEFE